MPGFDGTGPAGMGPMTGWGRGYCGTRGAGTSFAGRGLGRGGGRGFGFRGSSPPWPYVGRGRGGLPRCGYYSDTPWDTPYAPTAYAPEWTKEQELDILRSEAEAVKEHLEQIDNRIRNLESEGKKEGEC
jgi:hypothetical protein